ncbi:MAG: acetolactate synthase large subunit [Bryobacterales bacterium]|nr:acetolactate synthase large subunit [Bryobacterales bacterium]
MNGAEVLLRTLIANGVDTCFMNPGTSEMQFVAALDRVPEMRGVLCLFEGVCAGAADGFARMTGRPAATLLHLGPGLANGLANFHNARKARSAVVNIVGEHSTEHLRYDAPLTADVAAFAQPVSGWVRTLESAERMGEAACECVGAARSAPGQVATLIIPADHSWNAGGALGGRADVAARSVPDVRQARSLLGPATGLLLSGSALSEEALAWAWRISEATGTRVFANRYAGRIRRGRGVFGVPRVAYFPEPAEEMLAGLKDLILVEAEAPVSFFGYPNRRSTLAPLDCRMHVLAKQDEDGAGALAVLAAEFADASVPTLAAASLPQDGALTLETMGQTIAALLPRDAIVCDEMVSSAEPVNAWLGTAAAHDLLPVTGGSIGQGLPVAVGAAVACPGRKVIALEADGSGMYTLQALWTMARERLNVVVVIFANRRYRILDVEMKRTGAAVIGPRAEEMVDIGRPEIDWVRMAEGLGVRAVAARTAGEFSSAFAEACGRPGPCLIEAILAPASASER